ncbi:MAG: SdrD B-like domain-containing protein, partial [Thiothrix litoralis]
GTVITLNDSHVSANVSAQADGLSDIANAGPTDVVVTANFKVDTVKELKVTSVDPDTGEPLYIAPARPGPANENGTLVEYVIKARYVQGSMIANAPNEAGGNFEADYVLLDHFTDNNGNNNGALSSGGVLYTWNPKVPACELVGDHGPNAAVTCTQVNHLLDDLGPTLTGDGINDPNIEITLNNIDVRDPDKDSNLIELKLNLWFNEATEVKTHETCASTGRCTNTVVNSVGVYNAGAGTVDGFNPVSTEDASGNNLLNYNGTGEPEPNYIAYNMAYTPGGSLSMWISYHELFGQEKWAPEQRASIGETIPFLLNHFDYRLIDGGISQTCAKIDKSQFEYAGLSAPNRTDMGYAFNVNAPYNPHMAYRPAGGTGAWTQGADGSPFITILYSDEANTTLAELRDDVCNDDVNGDSKYVVDGINVNTGLADSPNDWVTDPTDLGGLANVSKIRQHVVYDQARVNAFDPTHDQWGIFTNHLLKIKDTAVGYGPNKYLPIFMTDRSAGANGTFTAWRDVSATPIATDDIGFSSAWGNADRTILVPSSHAISKYTEPRGIKVVRGGDRVDFIVEPQLFGMWSPTITTATVTDPLPAGTDYVLNSERFSIDGGTTWLDYASYAASSPTVTITSTPNSNVRSLKWVFGDLQSGEKLPLVRYSVDVNPGLVSGQFVNTATLNSDMGVDDNADGKSDPVKATYQLSMLAGFGLDVVKTRKQAIYSTNTPFTFDLVYKNLGGENYSKGDFIDVLPYNGDGSGQNSSGLASTRRPGTTFNGIYSVSKVVTGNGETVYATDALANTVEQDPCHESNQPSGYIPVAGDICHTPYVNNGNKLVGGSSTGTGSTVWTECTGLAPLTCGGLSADAITALRFNAPSISKDASGKSITLELTPLGNVGGTPALDEQGNVTTASKGNIYTNSFGGRVPELSLVVISNDVSVTVVSGSIGDYVWRDTNGDAVQDGDESGLASVTLQLLDSAGEPVYVNPTTGGIVSASTSDAIPYQVTTNSSGIYAFSNLPIGDYKVQVVSATLPKGLIQTFDFNGELDNGSTETLTLVTNTVKQTTGVENNTDQDFGYRNAKVNVSLTKSTDKTEVKRGETVVYTLTVTNTGADTATGVAISDKLPAGVTWVSDDGAGTYDNASGMWTIGELLKDTSKTLHITVTVN